MIRSYERSADDSATQWTNPARDTTIDLESGTAQPLTFALTVAVFACAITVVELVWAIRAGTWFKWTFVAGFAATTTFAGAMYWSAVRVYRRP